MVLAPTDTSSTPESGSPRPRWRLDVPVILILLLIGFSPAMSAGFLWDDWPFINTPILDSWSGLADIWFRPSRLHHEEHYWPMVYTTFWLEYQLWGESPQGYHIGNIILHGINSILLYRLAHRTNVPGAFWIGAIFAVHPVHVESVAWIIERKDVLARLGFFASANALLTWHERGSRRWFAVALLFFALGMLSKSIAIALPIAGGLFLWSKSGRLRPPEILGLLLMLAFGAGFIILDQILGQASESDYLDLSIVDRIQLAGKSIAFYAFKLTFPLNLMAIYPRGEINPSQILDWLPLLGIIIALGIGVLLSLKQQRSPLALFLFFIIAHGPTLGFIDFGFMRYAFVADRFQYLPSAAGITLIVIAIESLTSRIKINHAKTILMIAIMSGCTYLTFRQAQNYREWETFFRSNVERNPAAWSLHYNLALELDRQNRDDEAIDHFKLTIKHNPNHAKAHNNLGAILSRRGRAEESLRHFAAACKINPRYEVGCLNYIRALLLSDNDAGYALSACNDFLVQHPLHTEGWFLKGRAAEHLRRYDLAMHAYQQSIALDPSHAAAYNQMGLIHLTYKEFDAARDAFRAALAADPENVSARTNLERADKLYGP